VLFDFHNINTGGGQANFHVLNRNGVLTFQGRRAPHQAL
jgi:hypothetical protein